MIAIQAMALGISDLAARNLSLVPLIYLGPVLPAIAGALPLFRPALAERTALGAATG